MTINIQDKVVDILCKFGNTEIGRYKIQLLFDSIISKIEADKDKYKQALSEIVYRFDNLEMSVESNELRLGNYVNLISEGHEEEPDLVEWGIDDYEFYANRMNYIKPIRLTDEWIIKFGLSKEKGYPCKFTNGYLKIRNGVFFFKYHDIEVDLPFVHQLQNLNFALTGVDLQVS